MVLWSVTWHNLDQVLLAGIDMGEYKVFMVIAWLINDLRGIAGPFNAQETGAIHGACSQCICGVVGTSIKTLSCVCYICATSHTTNPGTSLSRDDPGVIHDDFKEASHILIYQLLQTWQIYLHLLSPHMRSRRRPHLACI
jgi:hypothetical protein